MSKRFELGKIVATAGVHAMKEENIEFAKFVSDSFMRYMIGDRGDTCPEDAKQNDESVENGERILAVYIFDNSITIWIITERDRSTTTILFPEEY